MEHKPNGIIAWIDYRLPIFSFLKHFEHYKTPKNLNYLWNLGAIAGVALVIQIISGIILAMHYTPHIDKAFDSVENIMRNVNYGWLIRYTHAVGASMFFAAVYIHMFRGLYYGSYKYPRELLWQIGLVIFIVMMATAFMGYVLPWGQMSYWGATVITSLFSAIPYIGDSIVTWLWGGYSVENATLNRFFALHYLLPFVILGLVVLHVVALHTHGSNNPTGKDLKEEDKIPFHPYYTYKDLFSFGLYFIIFSYFMFYEPNYLGHPDNYIPANPLVTPAHIVPEWYFLPFYAILRAVPSKLGGVILMFGSIFVLFLLPWLDRSPIRSGNDRPTFRIAFFIFLFDALLLGYVGGKPAEGIYITISRFAASYYFFHFLVLLPIISKYEEKKVSLLPSTIKL
jgi:ubiquinol-cytochrome c reductase cytochrome b subunit